MTHELYRLLKAYQQFRSLDERSVLVTLVALEGSSYRKPGVRMLISESGQMFGAVSGGCVEKEIKLQAQEVFHTGKAKLMTYDGRYRLGCEGILYLLIEPIELSINDADIIITHLEARLTTTVNTFYPLEVGVNPGSGSILTINEKDYPIHNSIDPKSRDCFKQKLDPLFELFIFGAEHDSVVLAEIASKLGWRITLIAPADEQKTIEDFKGASSLLTPLFSEVGNLPIHEKSAVILMTHSISKDVQYLLELTEKRPAYIGLLGPAHRRERLIEQVLEFKPEIDDTFIDLLRGPAGINIGAISAEEIAISIISEILAVTRSAELISLKDKSGAIHD